MTRRLQGNISYDVIFFIHACVSFHGTLKYHKMGTKLAYYIRIADYILLSVNNCCKNDPRLFENVDTETMVLLSDVASSSSFWPSLLLQFLISFVSDKSSPRHSYNLCLKNRSVTQAISNFLLITVIFDFQSKRNHCKYSKITHFNRYIDTPCDFLPHDSSYPEHLANSVNNTDTTLRARLSKSRLLSPVEYLPIYILIYIFSLFTRGLLGCLLMRGQ